MSDVAPSFFPTPHEIAGGLRWMREHPVVATAAAAAATAVSVLTYLKARADDVNVQLGSSAALRDGNDFDDSDSEFASPLESSLLAAALRLSSRSRSESQLLASPVKQRRRGTDCTNDDGFSSTESEVSTPSPTVRRSHPSSSVVSAFAFSSQDDDDAAAATTSRAPAAAGDASEGVVTPGVDGAAPLLSERGSLITSACFESVAEEDEGNSTSPQWGWYVSTTPPDEYYT
ncbi:hypothetical protein PybrP1_001277 [[Pythium] brassicae (nom. inval.)]|nr:hypothetical protein PybrP1_001277 [[Pythium] brassicae (nom. inval.)]